MDALLIASDVAIYKYCNHKYIILFVSTLNHQQHRKLIVKTKTQGYWEKYDELLAICQVCQKFLCQVFV